MVLLHCIQTILFFFLSLPGQNSSTAPLYFKCFVERTRRSKAKKSRGMARQLYSAVSAGGLGNAGLFFGASVIVCSFVLMVCGSHVWWRRRRWHSESVISIHQVQPGGDGEVCVWQKSILMGEKCQLPDFSGIITYDSDGNLVAPGRPRMGFR